MLVGDRVKWKDGLKMRFGFTPSAEGQVMRVDADARSSAESEIDVMFDTGEVVHGAAEHWFERIIPAPPAN